MKSWIIFNSIIGLAFLAGILLPGSVWAQGEFTDLNEALKHPDQVISIRLYSQTSYSESKELPSGLVQCKQLHKLFIGWHKNLDLKKLFELLAQLPALDTLELYACDLKNLPAEVGLLTQLSCLKVELNDITGIAPEIGKLDKLQSLSLGSNKLTRLPEEIGQMKNLRKLDLQNNRLVQLPSALCDLQKLETLYLWSNELVSLPENIHQLTSLKDLSIGTNKLEELPSSFTKLRLTALTVARNPFRKFPYEIFNIPTLESLGLYGLPIDSLPPAVSTLPLQKVSLGRLEKMDWATALARLSSIPTLVTLSIDRNHAGQLPAELSQLQHLKELHLTGIKKCYPVMQHVVRLTELERLHVEYYEDSLLPPEIGNLTQLRYLQFERNRLHALPPSIGQLVRLQELIVSGNGSEHLVIPKEIGTLLQLERAEFRSSHIKELPEETGNLSNLKLLNLWDSDLTDLPSSIGRLQQLETLILSGNSLKELPLTCYAMPSLKMLDLEQNEIRKLDTLASQWSSLEQLDLSGNIHLTELPASLAKLPHLKYLNVSNTQIRQLPPLLDKLPSLKTIRLCKTLIKRPGKYKRMFGDKLDWEWDCDEVEQLVVDFKEKYGTDDTQLSFQSDTAVLNYFYLYNEPNSIDEEYREKITIRVMKDQLVSGKKFIIPGNDLQVSAVFSSIWRFHVDYSELQGEVHVIHLRKKRVKLKVVLKGKFTKDRAPEELVNKVLVYKSKSRNKLRRW